MRNSCYSYGSWMSWDLSFPHPVWWCCTNRDAKIPLPTRPSRLSISDSGRAFGKRRQYDTMKWQLYALEIAKDAHTTIGNCGNCARLKRKLQWKMFLANRPLKFIAMDKLGLLSKMTKRNQFIIFITDWGTKIDLGYPVMEKHRTACSFYCLRSLEPAVRDVQFLLTKLLHSS